MTQRTIRLSGALIGSVWIFHGLYSKLLNGIPRHREIVARVVGEEFATPVTKLVGIGEVFLGFWTWSGRARKACATTQTAALAGMNTLEIARAKDVLISAPGMLLLNTALIAATWVWASSAPESRSS
jgi:hypothetical protein